MDIAKKHILQVMKTPSDNSMWKGNVEIVEKKILFDNEYEISGYYDNNYCLISGGDLSYFITDDFYGNDNCAPTAATNLYYYYAVTHGYWELELDSWDGTYNEFYKVMDTNEYGPGTYDSCIAYGYDVVFGVAGIRCDTNMHYGTDEGQKLVNDLNNDRPCHLIMHNHRNRYVWGSCYGTWNYVSVIVY